MIPDGMQMDRAGEIAELVERLAAGDVRALARALSLVEDASSGLGAAVLAECKRLGRGLGRRSVRVGVTGAAGSGKSSLVDRMVRVLRESGERVGVVAVDPTSPYTGGALLGDRIRMQGFHGDAGVFIRSMASRGAVGGVAAGVAGVIEVLGAAGFGWAIVETVGVGQGEVAVSELVDVTVLVVTPGMGDDVQSLKAGVMEAADIFAVNKADLAGADRVVADLVAMQGLMDGVRLPVVKTCGVSGAGVRELVEVVRSAYTDRTDKTRIE